MLYLRLRDFWLVPQSPGRDVDPSRPGCLRARLHPGSLHTLSLLMPESSSLVHTIFAVLPFRCSGTLTKMS